MSSWSWPESDSPFGASVATTLHGRLFSRMTLPIGSSTPKRFRRIVRPITQTSAARSTSSCAKAAPSSIVQRLISKYSGETPRNVVNQFWFP